MNNFSLTGIQCVDMEAEAQSRRQMAHHMSTVLTLSICYSIAQSVLSHIQVSYVLEFE